MVPTLIVSHVGQFIMRDKVYKTSICLSLCLFSPTDLKLCASEGIWPWQLNLINVHFNVDVRLYQRNEGFYGQCSLDQMQFSCFQSGVQHTSVQRLCHYSVQFCVNSIEYNTIIWVYSNLGLGTI